MGAKALIIGFFGICAITLLAVMIKRKCFFKGIFSTAIQGVTALYTVKLIGIATGTSLAVNWTTLGISALLGSPGVVLLLAAKTILN